MSNELNLAVIGGDGTGPEVVAEALRVLEAVSRLGDGLSVKTTHFDYGAAHYQQTGTVITDDEVDALRGFDAVLLGAVGHPDVTPGVIEKGLLLKLRFQLDQYINLRPVKLLPGIETPLKDKGPDDIDFVCVRENTEGLYGGTGGRIRVGTPNEISTQEMIATRLGVERCVRYAFETARSRKQQGYRGHLTLVHKTNVLTHCGATWMETFRELAAEYSDIATDYHHVDACCMYMATKPEIYDVIVVPNMFGDIITDLGAAIAGGMGIAASGNLNPDPAANSVSMFEPVHGSSPDIAGQGKANPLAAIDSLAMLLRETGRTKDRPALVEAGDKVAAAIQQVTPNFTGKRLDRSGYSTSDIGDMVIKALV
ncbi:MAG: 3-isopropylmalate dehydrogenase [Planctomycetota bacterium]